MGKVKECILSQQKLLSKIFLTAVGCVASCHAMAFNGTIAPEKDPIAINHPWSFIGSLGYTNYQNFYHDDGQTGIVRLAIGKSILYTHSLDLGFELGVQNGNTMRFGPSAELLALGALLPIQSTVKPVIDLLATVKSTSLGDSDIFALLKGGIAYRRWQFNDRITINDLSQAAGEVQAGFGYPLTRAVNLSLLYQGIYGSNPNLIVNTTAFTGHVSNIPIQQGVLLSLAFTI